MPMLVQSRRNLSRRGVSTINSDSRATDGGRLTACVTNTRGKFLPDTDHLIHVPREVAAVHEPSRSSDALE